MTSKQLERPQKYPPAHLLERIANDPDPAAFVKSFPVLRFAVKNYLEQAGLQFSQFKDILDLGCGVGRFAFAFKEELSPEQRLTGCDVYKECAHWCRDNIDFGEFQHTSVLPPLPYHDGQFDFVYALSVFTHLELEHQFTWAWELHRVLRPGGIVFVTIHGRLFIPLFFQSSLDYARSRTIYSLGENGLFAFMSSSGKAEDVGQSSVAAAQSREFVQQQFSAFEMVQAFPQSSLAGEQDLYIFRKPDHGRLVARPLGMHNATIRTLASPADSPCTLQFNLEGHRWFRVYPRTLVEKFLQLDCEVEIREAGGRLLVSGRFPLNKQRLYGHSHYAIVEVEVPEYHGQVVVILRCASRIAAAFETFEVEWNFPNFV